MEQILNEQTQILTADWSFVSIQYFRLEALLLAVISSSQTTLMTNQCLENKFLGLTMNFGRIFLMGQIIILKPLGYQNILLYNCAINFNLHVTMALSSIFTKDDYLTWAYFGGFLTWLKLPLTLQLEINKCHFNF